MVRKQLSLTPQQDDALRRLAKEEGVTLSELVRRAIDLVIQEEERRERARTAWGETPEGAAEEATTARRAAGRGWTRDDLYGERPGRFGAER